MSDQAVLITPELYTYACAHSTALDPLLVELFTETLRQPGGHMVSSKEQLQFMQLLVKIMGAKKILELGTFTGFTSLGLAMASDCDAKIYTCDINNRFQLIGKPYWHKAGVEQKIIPVVMPALSFLDELILQGENMGFDFVYIDADKKNYYAYFEKLLFLVRLGGLIVVDNVLWKSKVLEREPAEDITLSLKAFNAQVSNDPRVKVTLLTIGDGLMLISPI
jgi:caffeoyl-CoA O-methyltransferase